MFSDFLSGSNTVPSLSPLQASASPTSQIIQSTPLQNMNSMTSLNNNATMRPAPQPNLNYNLTSGFNSLNLSPNINPYPPQQNAMFNQFQPPQQQAQNLMFNQQFQPLQPQQQQQFQQPIQPQQQQQPQQLQPQRPAPALPQFGKPQSPTNQNNPLNSIQVPW